MAALAGLAYLFGSITFKGPSVAIEDDTETIHYKKPARKPASVSKPVKRIQPQAPTPQNYQAPSRSYSDRPDEPVVDERAGSVVQGSSYGSGYISSYSSAPSYRSRGGSTTGGHGSGTDSGGSSGTDTGSGTSSGPGGSSGCIPGLNCPPVDCKLVGNCPEPPDCEITGDCPPPPPPEPEDLPPTCTSNVGAGAYSNPVEVSLSTSNSASIKYHLSNTSICENPKTMGVTYTGSITVGAIEGPYCLSFYCYTSTKETSVIEQAITVDNTLPDLQVSHPVIQYQTTELVGVDHITSSDFGLMDHELGQINLTTNDPGPSGLNKNCEEVINSYVTFPAPSKVILTTSDVSGLTPSSQVNIPLRLVDLNYGDNFIFSFLANYSYAAPLYSCSTTKVKLFDFEYFQAEVAHGVPGTDTVREFEGGLSPYGFFEADPTQVYRGPAGSSAEDNGGQRLESGLFSIFY